jgi:hypothetical protein
MTFESKEATTHRGQIGPHSLVHPPIPYHCGSLKHPFLYSFSHIRYEGKGSVPIKTKWVGETREREGKKVYPL